MSSPSSGSPSGASSPSKRRGKKKQHETEEQERKQQHKKKYHHQGKQGKDQKGKSPQQHQGGGELAAAGGVPRLQRRSEKKAAVNEEEEATAAVLGAAAAMVAAADAAVEFEEEAELLQNKRKESFELYNKQLTTQMTFDEQGNPILAPLSKSVAVDAAFLATTMTAASDDTEGQIEAVPPPQGPCAGLCPPYGALPERMPLQEAGGEKKRLGDSKGGAVSVTAQGIAAALAEAVAAGEEVIEEGGELYIRKQLQDNISLYALPSRDVVCMALPEEGDCPVPVWQLLPPSPFFSKAGVIGVDIYAVKGDLGSSEFQDAIPPYEFALYAEEESAVADLKREPRKQEEDELLLKRRSTFFKSIRKPATIQLD